jgi:hypothetical protein
VDDGEVRVRIAREVKNPYFRGNMRSQRTKEKEVESNTIVAAKT